MCREPYEGCALSLSEGCALSLSKGRDSRIRQDSARTKLTGE